MTRKIQEALKYANSNSKLEGLNLSEEERNIILTKIESEETDEEFISLVKKLVKKEEEKKEE